jgi:hypothetical protein
VILRKPLILIVDRKRLVVILSCESKDQEASGVSYPLPVKFLRSLALIIVRQPFSIFQITDTGRRTPYISSHGGIAYHWNAGNTPLVDKNTSSYVITSCDIFRPTCSDLKMYEEPHFHGQCVDK